MSPNVSFRCGCRLGAAVSSLLVVMHGFLCASPVTRGDLGGCDAPSLRAPPGAVDVCRYEGPSQARPVSGEDNQNAVAEGFFPSRRRALYSAGHVETPDRPRLLPSLRPRRRLVKTASGRGPHRRHRFSGARNSVATHHLAATGVRHRLFGARAGESRSRGTSPPPAALSPEEAARLAERRLQDLLDEGAPLPREDARRARVHAQPGDITRPRLGWMRPRFRARGPHARIYHGQRRCASTCRCTKRDTPTSMARVRSWPWPRPHMLRARCAVCTTSAPLMSPARVAGDSRGGSRLGQEFFTTPTSRPS